PNAPTVFASGGFRGDLLAVNPVDRCIYATQRGVRYDDGMSIGDLSVNSLVRICEPHGAGFAAPPPSGGGGAIPPLSIKCDSLMGGTVNAAYNGLAAASGGVLPYTF